MMNTDKLQNGVYDKRIMLSDDFNDLCTTILNDFHVVKSYLGDNSAMEFMTDKYNTKTAYVYFTTPKCYSTRYIEVICISDYVNFNKELTINSEHIALKNHYGYWHVIDEFSDPCLGTKLYLLEHSYYGDETCCIITDKNANIIVDDVWNGFDDYLEAMGYDF